MKCKICGEKINREDLSDEFDGPKKAVYHDSFGVACLCHQGVAELYDELVKKADARLKEIAAQQRRSDD